MTSKEREPRGFSRCASRLRFILVFHLVGWRILRSVLPPIVDLGRTDIGMFEPGLAFCYDSTITAADFPQTLAIGFVGMMVPHIARRLVGSEHRRLLHVAILLGG